MPKRVALFLTFLLAVGACRPAGVVIVTATPSPVPTAAPVLTATPLPTAPPNPHADLPPFSVINPNPTLQGRPIVTNEWNRGIATPPGYTFVYTSPDNPPLPPYLYNQADGGYAFFPSWVRGTFGLREESIELYPGVRYIVKIIYSTDLATASEVNLDVGGAVYNTSGGTSTVLTAHAVPLHVTRREDIWVIETSAPYPTIALDLTFHLAWATISGGSITVYGIQVMTAPADYGSDALLGF